MSNRLVIDFSEEVEVRKKANELYKLKNEVESLGELIKISKGNLNLDELLDRFNSSKIRYNELYSEIMIEVLGKELFDEISDRIPSTIIDPMQNIIII